MASLRPLLPLLFILHLFLVRTIHCSVGSDGGGGFVSSREEFSEELLIKPLPDRKVLAHFHFRTTAPLSDSNGRHHHLFPKAISQLVHKYQIKELELSFTQGSWNYERWGGSDPLSTTNAKPPGVELWALFDLPTKQLIDATWRNLTHSLSGLFCASINFLESPTSYSTPIWGFLPNNGNLRYGALPREAVCTENLTPWLKLLPCRDKSGISSLLDRPSIYKSHYHSQRLKLVSSKSNGTAIEQTLTVVLKPNSDSILSLGQLFKKKVTGKCVIAKSSRVYLEIEGELRGKRGNLFELLSDPDREIKDENDYSTLYEYDVSKYSEYEPLDLGIVWRSIYPLDYNLPNAPFHANRFLMGSGNERGSIAINLQSNSNSNSNANEGFVKVVVFQVVPWYVKVYYHSLKIYIDGKIRDLSDFVEKINVSPSEDKVSPGTLEIMLQLPCGMDSATVTIDFDKGFLHIDEYPPDANQGFDIPSALVSFPDFHLSRIYPQFDSNYQSSLLQSFKERNIVKSYTEVLLVPLTTPDFSMPYNVITFTCTVLALYFGSMVNVLRRRIGEEERLSQSKERVKRGLVSLLISKIRSKIKEKKQDLPRQSPAIWGHKLLFIAILVAGLAVAWHFFLNTS